MGCSSSTATKAATAEKSASDVLDKGKKTKSSHSGGKSSRSLVVDDFGRSKSRVYTPASSVHTPASSVPTSRSSVATSPPSSSAGKRTISTLSHKFFRRVRTSTTSFSGSCCGAGAACDVDDPVLARSQSRSQSCCGGGTAGKVSEPDAPGLQSSTTSELEAVVSCATLEGADADSEPRLTEEVGASAENTVAETSKGTLPVLMGKHSSSVSLPVHDRAQSKLDSSPGECSDFLCTSPPANLLRDSVLKECSAISRQANGTLRKPTLKLAIQGRYVFTNVDSDPVKVADSTSSPRLQYYAATSRHASNGETLESVLRAVQKEAQLVQLSDLIDLLPDIEEAAMSNELSGREVQAVEAVVYHCVNAEMNAKGFLDWLDFAGFEMWLIEGFAAGVTLHAGIRDDRQALRITCFRDGVCMDAAYNVSSSLARWDP